MAEQKPQNEWEKKELGVLWSRTKKDSTEKFLTGKINLKNYGFDRDVDVVIFKNKTKTKDTHPDLRIYFSEPRPQASAGAAPAVARKPVATRVATPEPVVAQNDELI